MPWTQVIGWILKRRPKRRFFQYINHLPYKTTLTKGKHFLNTFYNANKLKKIGKQTSRILDKN